MKMRVSLVWVFPIAAIMILSCGRDDKSMTYPNVSNKLILNKTMFDSLHPDPIEEPALGELISTGRLCLDLNSDQLDELCFEIVDLHYFNGEMPDSLDSLAARVHTVHAEILDNSTYHYPDALTKGTVIGANGNWMSGSGVLGTFANAGQFQGRGERFLAFRFLENNEYRYGWIGITCSAHNDTLTIHTAGFCNMGDEEVVAGE